MTAPDLDTVTSASPDTLAAVATQAPDRPLRADARRNRERVLEAARTCFAEGGMETQMEDLAQHAGVGVGTVYRHFPSKEAVLEALARDHFQSVTEICHACLEIEDPWEALTTMMWRSAETLSANRALAQSMATGAMEKAANERPDLMAAVEALIARARDAGVLRKDALASDVPNIMCAVGRVQSVGGRFSNWRRLLAITIEGLRAPGVDPLPD